MNYPRELQASRRENACLMASGVATNSTRKRKSHESMPKALSLMIQRALPWFLLQSSPGLFSFRTPGLQVHTQCLLWGPKYTERTYFLGYVYFICHQPCIVYCRLYMGPRLFGAPWVGSCLTPVQGHHAADVGSSSLPRSSGHAALQVRTLPLDIRKVHTYTYEQKC